FGHVSEEHVLDEAFASGSHYHQVDSLFVGNCLDPSEDIASQNRLNPLTDFEPLRLQNLCLLSELFLLFF
ncbi:hypothetical protein Q6281_28600, partial [Klebsiella pneumoniae]